MSISFILQVLALVFMVFAAFNLFPNSKVSWGWFALALWFLSFMIAGFGLHPAEAIH
jgi:hypothetical protein